MISRFEFAVWNSRFGIRGLEFAVTSFLESQRRFAPGREIRYIWGSYDISPLRSRLNNESSARHTVYLGVLGTPPLRSRLNNSDAKTKQRVLFSLENYRIFIVRLHKSSRLNSSDVRRHTVYLGVLGLMIWWSTVKTKLY